MSTPSTTVLQPTTNGATHNQTVRPVTHDAVGDANATLANTKAPPTTPCGEEALQSNNNNKMHGPYIITASISIEMLLHVNEALKLSSPDRARELEEYEDFYASSDEEEEEICEDDKRSNPDDDDMPRLIPLGRRSKRAHAP